MQQLKTVTLQELTEALRSLGITPGMELEVHSSLSSFGYVEGGAETVIAALKACVTEQGSLFMPALRLSRERELTDEDRALGITTKIEILPEDCASTAMGCIADTFRAQPETQTGDGVFAISGWGRNAGKAVSGGLGHVLHHGGKALLLGVDIYKLTAMHYVEDLLPQEIKNIFAPNERASCLYPPTQWFVETGAPPVKAWYTIQAMAFERGLIQTAKIGNCRALFFDLWDVVGLYAQELRQNPYQLYGLNAPTA